MPLVTPDFEAQPTLQPGDYRATIKSCEQKTSKKGTAYLNWKFELQGGQSVYFMTGLTGKGAEIFKRLVQETYQPAYDGGPINTDDMVGQSLMVHVDKQIRDDGSEGPYLVVTDFWRDQDSFDAFEDFK